VLRLIVFISCGLEEIVAFLLGEEVAEIADSLPKLIVGSSSGSADQGFELGERHLDWVQVRAVGRKEQKPRCCQRKFG